MLKLILFTMLSVVTSSAGAEAVNECDLLNKGFMQMASKMATALLMPSLDFSFERQPDVESLRALEKHFAKGVECSEMKSPERDRIFLLLSNLEETFLIAQIHQYDPSLVQRALEGFATAVDLLAVTEADRQLAPLLEKVGAAMREKFKYRFPDFAGEAELAIQIDRFGNLQPAQIAALVKESSALIKQSGNLLGKEISRTLSQDESRNISMFGARLILNLKRLGQQTVQDSGLLDQLVDVVYGPRTVVNFQIPHSRAAHLKIPSPKGTRIAFIKNTTPRTGVSDAVISLAYNLERATSRLLKVTDPARAAAVLQDRLWGLNFLWNSSSYYVRSDREGLARPIAVSDLKVMIGEYFRLKPGHAAADLYDLQQVMVNAGSYSAWPVAEPVQLHIDATKAAEEMSQAAAAIEAEMNDYDEGDLDSNVADLRSDNQEAQRSLEESRMRLHGMTPSVRIANFKARLMNCEGLMANGAAKVVDLKKRK